jgi:hypothetical protein
MVSFGSIPRASKFDNVDRAFVQRMLASSVLTETEAEQLLVEIVEQFDSNGKDRELHKTIKKINKSLKPLVGLEIVKRSHDAHGDVYYGVVNTDGDVVAEKYGSSFEAWELEVLRAVVQQIVSTEDGYVSHQELENQIYETCGKKYKKDPLQVRRLVQLFREQKWLVSISSNNRNGFCLGARSFLEIETELFALGAAKCSKTNQLVVKDRSLWQFSETFVFKNSEEEE